MKPLLSILFLLLNILLYGQPDSSFIDYTLSIPGSGLQYKMIAVKGGLFTMGSPDDEKGRNNDEGPQRKFSISPFWMGAYEVTHDEFDVFYNDVTVSQNSQTDAITRPSAQYVDLSWGMGKSGGYPVNSMQQKTALMYCRWLYRKTGIFYRLPTEAEWEYACRAGTRDAYYFGGDVHALDKYAWFRDNSQEAYHKTGQLLPNAWGFYDMLGNVAEWVLDQYDEKYYEQMKDMTSDPLLEPTSRNPRLLKGGGYTDVATDLRCASRKPSLPKWNRRDPQIPKSSWWLTDAPFAGFRIIRPWQQPSGEEIERFFNLYLGQ
ncbi:MAG: SUMF1/EgtB/PvdO family nonheme iron enzyme [Terrimonas sp.]|nr:SUMF1/EgtB/PvdO family nonheme iron enzyme [Terrimonas sp.]